MEKFGIFELLDALSALTEREDTQEDKPSAEIAAAEPPADGSPEPPKPQKPKAESDALAGFYARHNAVAKRASEKK